MEKASLLKSLLEFLLMKADTGHQVSPKGILTMCISLCECNRLKTKTPTEEQKIELEL